MVGSYKISCDFFIGQSIARSQLTLLLFVLLWMRGRKYIFIYCLFENFAVLGVYLGKSLVTKEFQKFLGGLRKFFGGKFFRLNNFLFAIHPLAVRSVFPLVPYACIRIILYFEILIILLWETTSNTEHKSFCNPF